MIGLSVIDIFMNKDFVSTEWILEFIKVIFWRNYVINSKFQKLAMGDTPCSCGIRHKLHWGGKTYTHVFVLEYLIIYQIQLEDYVLKVVFLRLPLLLKSFTTDKYSSSE